MVHLVRPKDTVDPAKQDGVVYRIPCECGKIYIGESGRSMHERIKEHDRDIQLARTQTSAVSEHAHKTDHYPLHFLSSPNKENNFNLCRKNPIKSHACAFDQKIVTGCVNGNELFSKEPLVRIS